ncbi:MAG: hypothetical protein ACYC9L_03215 [Sulfuricaulis sp.]
MRTAVGHRHQAIDQAADVHRVDLPACHFEEDDRILVVAQAAQRVVETVGVDRVYLLVLHPVPSIG